MTTTRVLQEPSGATGLDDPVLVYDGGCPFCSHFAVLSELRGGIPGLRIVDGRDAAALRHQLAARGFHLRDGAMLLQGEQVLHGAAAITWICGRLRPSAPLLQLLGPLFRGSERSRRLYPLLLLGRRLALALKGLPVDPDGLPLPLVQHGQR